MKRLRGAVFSSWPGRARSRAEGVRSLIGRVVPNAEEWPLFRRTQLPAAGRVGPPDGLCGLARGVHVIKGRSSSDDTARLVRKDCRMAMLEGLKAISKMMGAVQASEERQAAIRQKAVMWMLSLILALGVLGFAAAIWILA